MARDPRMKHVSVKAICVAATCLLTACAIGPDSLLRTHAYEGPARGSSEIATVFAVWHAGGGELSFICNVDGKSYRRMGAISSCPSVVYLLAGRHDIGLEYRYANLSATAVIPATVEAGKAYRVTATSVDKAQARFTLREMPPGFVLTFKDLAPLAYRDGSLANAPVDPAVTK